MIRTKQTYPLPLSTPVTVFLIAEKLTKSMNLKFSGFQFNFINVL